MKVAITYHEDFGRYGFSVLKERIQPSFEALMQSGLVDGDEIQVFKAKPAPLNLVEKAHTTAHMANMQTDPYREVALLSAGSVMMAAKMVAWRPSQVGFCLYGYSGSSCQPGKLLGILLL